MCESVLEMRLRALVEKEPNDSEWIWEREQEGPHTSNSTNNKKRGTTVCATFLVLEKAFNQKPQTTVRERETLV